LATDPKQRATAMLLRGNILAQKSDLAGAETAFNEALKVQPGNRTALLARVSLSLLTQKYDAATRDLRAVLAQNPNDSGALVLQADLAARQGRDADARANFAKAIAVSPQDAGPRLSLARYLTGRGDLKGGLAQVSNVTKLQPSNPIAVELQGALQLKLGQRSEAVANFRRLVSLVPNSADAQVSLANALFLSGDRPGTIKALDAAVALAPKSQVVRAAQIKLQLAMGQGELAVSSAQAFRSANPGWEGDILAAEALTEAHHADQAMDILSKSFASKPTRLVLSRYGRLAVMQNQAKRADDALASWLQKNPGDMGARLEFAQFYMLQNDLPRATAQYDAVLKRQPDNVLAMNNLGGLLQASNPGRASELLTKAVQLVPNSPDINDSLGWLKVQQKDVANGLSYLRRAHDLRSSDPAISYHLVVALDANGKRNDARALLKSLLASGKAFPDKQSAIKLSSQWQ
jgi:putative PEP-CTERM system TPR-repeat lipoprotein